MIADERLDEWEGYYEDTFTNESTTIRQLIAEVRRLKKLEAEVGCLFDTFDPGFIANLKDLKKAYDSR